MDPTLSQGLAMKLHHHPLSGHSHRAVLIASLLNIPHELVEVDLKARIANDTNYGLQNYVLAGDGERARQVARQLDSGRVVINGAPHEPLAPFGGFRQSGIGWEYGAFGLTAFLEPRAIKA
jgi:hypothetical protein